MAQIWFQEILVNRIRSWVPIRSKTRMRSTRIIWMDNLYQCLGLKWIRKIKVKWMLSMKWKVSTLPHWIEMMICSAATKKMRIKKKIRIKLELVSINYRLQWLMVINHHNIKKNKGLRHNFQLNRNHKNQVIGMNLQVRAYTLQWMSNQGSNCTQVTLINDFRLWHRCSVKHRRTKLW